MVMALGIGLYGRVSKVNGIGYVATRFFHVLHFPLIPMKSYAIGTVVNGTNAAVVIPLSRKSILMAWLRAGIIITLTTFCLLAVVIAFDHRETARSLAMAIGASVTLAVAWYLTHNPFGRANDQEARKLALALGIPAEQIVQAGYAGQH